MLTKGPLNGTVVTDPYATCFSKFTVKSETVNGRCTVSLIPDASSAKLQYGVTEPGVPVPADGAQNCPTATLTVFADGTDLAALNTALTRAFFKASFAAGAITSATFATGGKRLVLDTPLNTDHLYYAVTSGSVGAVVSAATNANDACDTDALCSAATCAANRYKVGQACALCPPGSSCASNAATECPAGKYAQFAGAGV